MTKKEKRLAVIVAVMTVTALAATLVLLALKNSVSYFYMPADLAAEPQPPAGLIRVGGLVAAGSVVFDEGEEMRVNFIIEDGAAKTPVTFKGVLPDLFREGQGVIVQGRLDPDRTLVATEVLAKHDENYMPKEVADALKQQGRWQEGGGR